MTNEGSNDRPLQLSVLPTRHTRPPFPDYVDNSARSDFIKCPTKWMYSFLLSLAGAAPSIHLHAGGAFAKGLEVARRKYWEEGADIGEAKRAGLQAIIAAYGAFVAPATRQGDKSLDGVIRAFDSYMKQYPLDTDPIKPLKTASGRCMIEFTFSIPTEVKNPSTGNPILLTGRSDMIGTIFDTVCITDEKTTTQLGESWSNQWKLDSQPTTYIFAAKHYGWPVTGALIRGVGLLKTKITHAEVQVFRGQWEIDRWWEQYNKDLRKMVAAYEAFDFDKALDKFQCNAYGGCPFLLLCDSPEPERWLNQYRIRVWNPLAKDFGENLLQNPVITAQPNDDLVIDLKDLM